MRSCGATSHDGSSSDIFYPLIDKNIIPKATLGESITAEISLCDKRARISGPTDALPRSSVKDGTIARTRFPEPDGTFCDQTTTTVSDQQVCVILSLESFGNAFCQMWEWINRDQGTCEQEIRVRLSLRQEGDRG